MQETLFTTHEVSRFCNVYPTTVIKWINEGILAAFTTPGGHRRIKKRDLIKLIDDNNMPMPDELTRGSQPRILVIDDNIRILKMITTVLQAEKDWDIASVSSSFKAGVVVSEWKPDLILLDFLMPEIDGFEICKGLKANESTKNIPVIAVTVLRDAQDIKRMYACGVSDYLAKPFTAGALVERVGKYLAVKV
ncbi:MAG: response regulator [Omnitrophica bacterium]|nr:response regulator [Candidatus Omnitrophota bacterium]